MDKKLPDGFPEIQSPLWLVNRSGKKRKSFCLQLCPQEDTFKVHHRAQAAVFRLNPFDQLPVDI